jgi:hypothetical protein
MARALFENWRASHRSTAIRLLGVGVSGLEAANAGEGSAGDLADSSAQQDLDRVSDAINRRYGGAGIVHAQTLKRRQR